MPVVRLVVLFSLFTVSFAATIPLHNGPPACDPNTGIGCLPSPKDCPEGCGCNNKTEAVETDKPATDSLRRPSERTEFKFVKTVTNYDSAGLSDENDMGVEDTIATQLHEKVEHVFRGIIVSAILFIVCACLCVLSVCIYCCHIRHMDRKLKEEVDALAKKLKVDGYNKAGSSRRPIDDKAQSCNVVVTDADVMCV